VLTSSTLLAKKPRQARAKARMEKILSAAEKLLITQGLEAISTTNIANTASIPVGSVYQYFKDKNAILMQLYSAAYNDIEKTVRHSLLEIKSNTPFETVVHGMLWTFWENAKTHPTFRILTRWANSQRSLWETTPNIESSLGELIQASLSVAGVSIPPERKEAALTVIITVVSVLVDVAIEEQDERKTVAVLDELVILLTRYIN